MQPVEELAPLGLAPKAKALKRLAQRERIAAMLVEAGPRGCTSEELNPVAFRYSAVIHTLRHKEGYIIETHARTNTELARYIYRGRVPEGGQVPLF